MIARSQKIVTLLHRRFGKGTRNHQRGFKIAYEPDLVPPPELMRREGVDVLEDWFRWAEAWSVLLRVYGGMTRSSSVLEIGCGLGRIAFPLRYVLLDGSYEGLEISREQVAFLKKRFTRAHPNFRFTWANIRNSYYNPGGLLEASQYRFPFPDRTFDLVYAASVFTHMLPEGVRHYIREAARVLKPGGRFVFSAFLLDNYQPQRARPLGFARSSFNFDHVDARYGEGFAMSDPSDPERMTAFSAARLERFSHDAGLVLARPPIDGLWSGRTAAWIIAQELIVLEKPEMARDAHEQDGFGDC